MPTRQIRDIVHNKKILTAPKSMTVRDAVKKMTVAQVGAILIVEENRLIGIFTERDVMIRMIAADRNLDTTLLEEVMSHNPKTVKPDLPFAYAMCVMHDHNFRHLPVVENGIVLGVVSARDALGQELVAVEKEIERQESLSELL